MIQRYGFNGKCIGEAGRCLENMVPDDDGEFVLLYDYETEVQRLTQERDELQTEVERLRHDIERHMAALTESVNRAEKAEAEVERLRRVGLGASNYIEALGGDSKGFRIAIDAERGES